MTIPEEHERPFVDSNLNEINPPPYNEIQRNPEDTGRIYHNRERSNSSTRRNQRIIRRLRHIQNQQLRLRERTNFILLGLLIRFYNIFNNLVNEPQLLIVKTTNIRGQRQVIYSLGNFSVLLATIFALLLVSLFLPQTV